MTQASKLHKLLLFSYRGYRRAGAKTLAGLKKNFAQPILRKAGAKLSLHSADREPMISAFLESSPVCEPLDHKQIEARLGNLKCLPSLASIETALKELLNADQSYTTQIAEIIRRDPSLTSRLLHLVNSVYYGLANPIKNIEEAVFFLGVRQIRQLAMVTPVIEEFQKLAVEKRFPWRQFWRHCIGTALITRELVDLVKSPDGESDYVSGLVHDVGKIVMSSAFPDHFRVIYGPRHENGAGLMEIEREILGMDHAELGALYLKKQSLSEVFIEVARYHHDPKSASCQARTVAAVQVADMMVRYNRIGKSGNNSEVAADSWRASPGWQILFASQSESEQAIARASLTRSLERIPAILKSMV
jgi:putative nucleotidyltransferase with HDIG domain